jgi:predicted O-methyltransferase YrrM
LKWAVKLSAPGSVIVVDNVIREGAIIEENNDDPNVQATRKFFEELAAEPRLSATTIQTVGSKGYDGFTIAIVVG